MHLLAAPRLLLVADAPATGDLITTKPSPSDPTDAGTAGHPAPDATSGASPDPNPTYVDRPAKDEAEAEEAHKEGPGHAS